MKEEDVGVELISVRIFIYGHFHWHVIEESAHHCRQGELTLDIELLIAFGL